MAADDADSVTEDTDLVATGTVLPNDSVGADTNATPVTPANVTLTYGSLVLNGDGSYTYTLNNTLPAVNALNAGQTLTDTYTYTLTDGDGTTDTAVLTITINGNTDGGPSVSIRDDNGGAAGEQDPAGDRRPHRRRVHRDRTGRSGEHHRRHHPGERSPAEQPRHHAGHHQHR